jgi:cytidylate kinase
MSLITISKSMGSGGSGIAKGIAEKLHIEIYDDQRLQQEAVNMGIRADELKGLDEKAPGLFDRLWGSKPELYLDLMESVVYEVAGRGEGVILGHGSQLLLRDFGCALHVLIHASQLSRVEHIMHVHGVSKEVAEKLMEKNDHEREGFLRYAFHMDANDPSLYDLVINTEKIGTDGAEALIMEAGRSQKIKECSIGALESMERLSLGKKIKAEFLRNHFDLSMLHLEVAEKGVVYIKGLARNEDEAQSLVGVARSVPGVNDVQSEIAVMPKAAY